MTQKIGSVFTRIKNGATIKQSEYASGIPITRIQTISNGVVDRNKFGYADIGDPGDYADYILQDGDILMSHINSLDHLGKCAIYFSKPDEIVIHGMNLLVLRCDRSVIDPWFALRYFQSSQFKRFITRIAKKSVNQASFSIADLKKISIPTPSLSTQRKIAALIASIDMLRESYSILERDLDHLVKSRFIEMFGDELTQCVVPLSDACQLFTDGDWIESKDQSKTGIRLIQTGNVGNGKYLNKSSNARYISEETFEKLKCTEVRPGDLLISRLPHPVGRCCIIPEGLGRAITAVDCTILRLNRGWEPQFILWFTKTDGYQNQISNYLTGTTRKRISRSNLGKILVPKIASNRQLEFSLFAEEVDKLRFDCEWASALLSKR